MSVLERINEPKDIKNLNKHQMKRLAQEIRDFLIAAVSKTGGHLASNLGVVELTIALFRAFDLPEDKIVWDVGHQTYVHKILTGRRDKFATLRTLGGISGFPKTEESEFDAFNTGHSSTSISAALGLMRAKKMSGESGHTVAVIGDGALTGGMAYEGLDAAGALKENFIVVLNDNEMSISKNVGSLSNYLTRLRSKPTYFRFKAELERHFLKIKGIGRPTVRVLKKIKDKFRYLITYKTTFEDLGFTYLGPIDGHNIKLLAHVLESAKLINAPVLVHVVTKKGKGYNPAETRPADFHGVSAPSSTNVYKSPDEIKSYSDAFGKKLLSLAKDNENLCALTAAMVGGTGLSEFAEKYPDRFFDVAIAEQHAVTFAAGLAKGGKKPVVCVYSSFMQRAYDQILHDVCLQNLDMVLCIDRAGIVGEDGETHQGLFDISFLSHMPNMTVLSPSNTDELMEMLEYAVNIHKGPIAIRYPRGKMEFEKEASPFEIGKMDIFDGGKDVLIMFAGPMGKYAIQAQDVLKINNIGASLANLKTLMPIDKEYLKEITKDYSLVVTLEDGVRRGGVGEYIASLLSGEKDVLIKAHKSGIVQHGAQAELYRICRLDGNSIAEDIMKKLEKTDE